MRAIIALSLGMCVWTCLASASMASAPAQTSYQGELTTAAGDPVPPGIYHLRFRIYDARVGGNLLWESRRGTDPYIPVNVVHGRYSVILGGDANPLRSYIGNYPSLWIEATQQASNADSRPRIRLNLSRVETAGAARTDPRVARHFKAWEIGFALSALSYIYEEPGVMREEGLSGSLRASVDYAAPAGTVILDASYRYGSVRYTGGISDLKGTTIAPLEVGGIANWDVDVCAAVGRTVRLGEASHLLPYAGLGLRRLRDNLQAQAPGPGYRRESTYYFSPVGCRYTLLRDREPRDRWVFRAEYRHLWKGRQRSRMSDVDFGDYTLTDVVNSQPDGYGLSALIEASRMFGGTRVGLALFIDFWDIDNSDFANTYVVAVTPAYHAAAFPIMEPANTTLEWGGSLVFYPLSR